MHRAHSSGSPYEISDLRIFRPIESELPTSPSLRRKACCKASLRTKLRGDGRTERSLFLQLLGLCVSCGHLLVILLSLTHMVHSHDLHATGRMRRATMVDPLFSRSRPRERSFPAMLAISLVKVHVPDMVVTGGRELAWQLAADMLEKKRISASRGA